MLQITINNKEQDNIKAIQVDDYLVIVDKRSKLKKEDYVCSVLYGIGKVTSDNHENYKGEFPLLAEFLNKPNYFIPYNIDGSYCNDGKKIYKNDCFKIITSTKRIDKSIPLIIFKEKSVDFNFAFNELYPDWDSKDVIEYREQEECKAYIKGYNQVKSSDKKYTEEDILKAIELARDIKDEGEVFTAEDIVGCTEICTYDWKFNMDDENIINSLNQPKLPKTINLEFERTRYPKGDDGWEDVYRLKTTISTEEGDEIHITI